mmetsp:Transcript_88955/g.185892  ORF Transcript_88955/g.185892 Transcript_88955/m.185892 type:complete len:389 (+) Transcript_88955:242-1408(+)
MGALRTSGRCRGRPRRSSTRRELRVPPIRQRRGRDGTRSRAGSSRDEALWSVACRPQPVYLLIGLKWWGRRSEIPPDAVVELLTLRGAELQHVFVVLDAAEKFVSSESLAIPAVVSLPSLKEAKGDNDYQEPNHDDADYGPIEVAVLGRSVKDRALEVHAEDAGDERPEGEGQPNDHRHELQAKQRRSGVAHGGLHEARGVLDVGIHLHCIRHDLLRVEGPGLQKLLETGGAAVRLFALGGRHVAVCSTRIAHSACQEPIWRLLAVLLCCRRRRRCPRRQRVAREAGLDGAGDAGAAHPLPRGGLLLRLLPALVLRFRIQQVFEARDQWLHLFDEFRKGHFQRIEPQDGTLGTMQIHACHDGRDHRPHDLQSHGVHGDIGANDALQCP